MSFFYNSTRAEARSKPAKKPRLQDIPIQSLHKLGCSVCPRDKDASKLHSPKMLPTGNKHAPIYLLGSAPSEEEDSDNNHWTDKAGTAIYEMFGESFMRKHVRSNFIQQCRGDMTDHEIECCRPRIVADIEACKPQVIVTIGDAPFKWATGITSGALTNRGEMFVTKIGNHVCWVFSILYPNFVHKKRHYGKSEFERALEHDVERILNLSSELLPPTFYAAPYDAGIEIITGQGSGDFARLEAALQRLSRAPKSAMDFEATCLRPYMHSDALLLTASVGTFDSTVAFSVEHPQGWSTDKRRRDVLGLLGEYIAHSGRKACHHLGMEMEWVEHKLSRELLRRTEWDDTMAMAHTFDERPGTKSLAYQTRKHFGFDVKAQSPVDVRQGEWWLKYDLESILRYNGMDTKWTDKLRDVYLPRLESEPRMMDEYERKVRLAPTLVLTETVGLIVDQDRVLELESMYLSNLKQIEAKLKRQPEIKDYEQRYGTFQPTNPDHVLKLYRDVLPQDAVRVEDKRDGGKVRWTTEEDALAQIKAPSAQLILDHRGQSKILGTYIQPARRKDWICPDDRVRCKYGSMVAETGRLNAEDPNTQNFPKRKHREVRSIIVPPRHHKLVACDYGQIEFRVIGMASEDTNLVKYCWTGYDVHGHWATRIAKKHGKVKDYIWHEFQDTIRVLLKKDPDEDKAIMKTLRQEAKNGWVFPQFFGSSARSCAANLHIPEETADELAAEFWDEFPGVKSWQKKLMRDYEQNLYVETLGGRRRRGALSLNQVINLPIQGTAADIVTEGMNVLSERADAEADPELQPVLNVHDDLTFYIHEQRLETKIPTIAREMCRPRFSYINVPLIVEVSVGDNWHELQEIKVYRSNELFDTPSPYQ